MIVKKIQNKYSKEFRLISKQDFLYLKNSSVEKTRKYVCKDFCIYYKSNQNNFNHARLGISVSKKSGKAVYRNKFKRIIKNWFRNSIIKNKEFDILIVVSNRVLKQRKIDDAVLSLVKELKNAENRI